MLPVTQLNFGGVIDTPGRHTLSRLRCSGRETVSGEPTNCADLALIGFTMKGFYQVKGTDENENNIVTVYCDFNQSPIFESINILEISRYTNIRIMNGVLKMEFLKFYLLDRDRRGFEVSGTKIEN